MRCDFNNKSYDGGKLNKSYHVDLVKKNKSVRYEKPEKTHFIYSGAD